MKSIKLAGVKGLVPVSQVMYIIGQRNYSEVYTNDGKYVLTPMLLKSFKDQTNEFVRIHRGTLVNPEFIKKIALAEPGKKYLLAPIIMLDGMVLAVACHRREALLAVKGVGVYD